jgi:hypothetical protein
MTMKYSLRSLMIAVLVAPPLLAGAFLAFVIVYDYIGGFMDLRGNHVYLWPRIFPSAP